MPKKLDPKVAEAVMLKAGLKPLEPYAGAHTRWKCKCLKCGDIVHPIYNSIQQGGGGCRSCANTYSGLKRRMPEEDAIKFMVKRGLKPLEPFTNTNIRWKCKCLKCGDIVYPTYSSIKQGRGGCIYCGRIRSTNARRIPKKVAIEIMLKARMQPLEPFTLANDLWKCRCMKCKKVIFPSLTGVKGRGDKCAYCSKNKVDEKDAIKIMLKAKLKPLEPFKSSLGEWKCKCLQCGLIVFPNFNYIDQGNGGCNACGIRRRIEASKTPEKDAIKIMLKAKMKPLEPYVNTKTRWKCKCMLCGIIISPTLGSIIRGSGCANCSTYGIDLVIPSYLYLITNKELNAHKVGMGNVKAYPDRLKSFLKWGWEAHKVWQTKTGAEALEIEKAVFKIIRKDMKLPIYLSKEDMPKTGGETETVDADSITLLQLEKIINKVI